MAQVYGCIECGMLFAGWEYCLAHIEHCRPQHYLEVDKKTLKEMCTIGHRKCLVPAYQPALIRGNYGASQDSTTMEGDYTDLNNTSKSYGSDDDDSAGESTLTNDFLNPMEHRNLNHVAANVALLAPRQQQLATAGSQHSYEEGESDYFDGQEQMVMQLFDNKPSISHNNVSTNTGSSLAKRSLKARIKKRNKLPATSPTAKSTKAATPKATNPKATTAATAPLTPSSYKKKLRLIEKRLHQLIHEASPVAQGKPKMLLLEVLPKVFEVQFGNKLEFKELGFSNVKALIDAIPSVSVVVVSPYYNIEHEYLCFTDPNKQPTLLSWGADESDEELSHVQPQAGQISSKGSKDKYLPSPKYRSSPQTPSIPKASSSMEEQSFSNQKTPQHHNTTGKPFSFSLSGAGSQSSDEESSRRRERREARDDDEEEDESISDSTTTGISSCGSSRSVISALAEMLPNTNAYGSLHRVLAKHPGGITIGKLMLQAPEFKNFLSHCTDRRCEAQIKLAHTVLQHCPGISHRRASDGSILYFQVPRHDTTKTSKPFSIITRRSQEDSFGIMVSASASIEEQAAKLFAASEFNTPTPSPRHAVKHGTKELISTPTKAQQQPEPFRRPPRLDTTRLDTISSNLQATTTTTNATTPTGSPLQRSRNNTPTASRNNSPTASRNNSPRASIAWPHAPSTPTGRPPSPARFRVQAPSTPPSSMAREISIAENAARILAEAQSMTTPKSENKHNVSPATTRSNNDMMSEEAAQMLSIVQVESSSNMKAPKTNSVARTLSYTPNKNRNTIDYRADTRLYFFADGMASNLTQSFSSEDCVASHMTTDTVSASSANSDQSGDGKPPAARAIGNKLSDATKSQAAPIVASAAQSALGGANHFTTADKTDSTAVQSARTDLKGGKKLLAAPVSQASTINSSHQNVFQGAKSPDAKSTDGRHALPIRTVQSMDSKTAEESISHPSDERSEATRYSSLASNPEQMLRKVKSVDAALSVTSSHVSQGSKNLKKLSPLLPPLHTESREEVIEKIALDMFPTTNMHYKLLLALAENPSGMTWKEIDSLIPRFSPFVQKHGGEKGFQNLEPWTVLEACVSVRREKVGESDLYFINAPKMMPSRTFVRNNGEEETSVTSDMTEESSSYHSSSIQRPSALSLAFAGSDIEATLFFLGRITQDFRGRVWPASWEQCFQFLVRLDKESIAAVDADRQKFHVWTSSSPEGEPNSHRRKALRKILDQLQRLNCVTWRNSDLRWHEETATTIVKCKSNKSKQQHKGDLLGRGNVPVSYIETMEQLQQAKEADPFCSVTEGSRTHRMVSVMCEGALDRLYFVLIGTESITYIFDCVKLKVKAICDVLSGLFMNGRITKAFHDVHSGAAAFAHFGGLVTPLSGVFDTQLGLEALTGTPSMTPDQMFRQLGLDTISPKHPMKRAHAENPHFFGKRPLSPEALSYAADRLDLLTASAQSISSILQKGCRRNLELLQSVLSASDARAAKAFANGGRRHVCYDLANGYSLSSEELLTSHRPTDVHVNAPVYMSKGIDNLLNMLPEGIVERDLNEQTKGQLTSVSFEPGRPATAWIDGNRVELGRRVTAADIEFVSGVSEGGLENGEVAGLRDQLHRISAVRNWNDHIVGLTVTVGVYVTGASNMILDLLFEDPTRSILLIGESGSGKTTALRDAARLLAEKMSVSIIDTNKEIAGCCHAPHSSVGKASRVMVHKREEQCVDMMRCVREQRPKAIVIDELDTGLDVSAANYCKRCSTRLIASVVGGGSSIEDLLNDPSRSPLLGGVREVAVADDDGNNKGTTTRKVRASEPIFDVIVELRRGAYNEWRVIDTADAVDATLSGKAYQAQVRSRDPETGGLLITTEQLH